MFNISFSKVWDHILHPFTISSNDNKLFPTQNKTKIIALSVLLGAVTFGVGGALLFYGWTARNKAVCLNTSEKTHGVWSSIFGQEDLKSIFNMAVGELTDKLYNGIESGNLEDVKNAVEMGANVNFEWLTTDYGRGPVLYMAIIKKQFEIAMLLLENGAKPDVEATRLFLISFPRAKIPEQFKPFFEEAQQKIKHIKIFTEISMAISSKPKNFEKIKKIVEKWEGDDSTTNIFSAEGSIFWSSIVEIAIDSKNLRTVEYLLEKGAAENLNVDQKTDLMTKFQEKFVHEDIPEELLD